MLITQDEKIHLKKTPTEVEANSKARIIGGSLHIVVPKHLCKLLEIKQGDELFYVIHQIKTSTQTKNVTDLKYI